MVNSRSAGSFISEVAPPASVTTIGSATESMIRLSRSLSARACTSATPQPAIVLFDLLARAPQVADVAQNRDDAGAVARILGDRAEQLEEQVRAVDRIDEQQLAARRAGLLDRLARERRRQQHVVHAHGAAPALALLFRRREQRQRARVGDQQPALGVGQQNRVGDRVDDAVEQRALAPLLAIAVGERLLAEESDRASGRTRR